MGGMSNLRMQVAADRKMFLEGILLLLFVILTSSFTGSSEILIKVHKKTETTKEGSSVTIPCVYLYREDQLKLLWFKDSQFDHKTKLFNGTIVYSNTDERPTSPEYSKRVEYITDITSKTETNKWIQCDLRITDLQTTDSGNYSFRFIGSGENKYMSTAMNLTVTENPCKVHIEAPEQKNPLKESEEFTVNCSTFASCSDHPEWLIYTPGQTHEWKSSLTDMITKTKEEDGRAVTKLKLNLTWTDDKRILSCRPAQDKDSSQFRNITLSVEYAPKETTANVSSEDVKEGDSVTLSCTSRGHPNVTFSWFKKERIENSQTSDLDLKNVKPEDSGNYYCEAKNNHGEMKSNIITIDVKYGPKDVTVKPLVEVEDLKEGDKLELECSVKRSNPEVKQFIWYKNNTELLQQTNKTLTISEVTADDRGSYHCQADNYINSMKSNEILVSVQYTPKINIVNNRTEGNWELPVYLTCSADAYPPASLYEWYRKEDNTTVLSDQQNFTVQPQNPGMYYCTAANSIGKSQSKHIKLFLKNPCEVHIEAPELKNPIKESEEFTVNCSTFASCSDHPEWLIYTSGQTHERMSSLTDMITKTKEEDGRAVTKLNLNLTWTDDKRILSCRPAQDQDSGRFRNITLSVEYAPKETTANVSSEDVKEGDSVTLSCTSRGHPNITFSWFKKETIEKSQTSDLELNNVKPEDSGNYYCEAKNNHGAMKSNIITIDVKYGPKDVTVKPLVEVEDLKEGDKLKLECSVKRSNPEVKQFTWYKNNTELLQQTNKTLTISEVTADDRGSYHCQADNNINSMKSNEILVSVKCNPVEVLYQIILPIILLLILIVVAIVLIRRTINKKSQNNTRENLSMEDIPDPIHGSVNQSHPTPHS